MCPQIKAIFSLYIQSSSYLVLIFNIIDALSRPCILPCIKNWCNTQVFALQFIGRGWRQGEAWFCFFFFFLRKLTGNSYGTPDVPQGTQFVKQ